MRRHLHLSSKMSLHSRLLLKEQLYQNKGTVATNDRTLERQAVISLCGKLQTMGPPLRNEGIPHIVRIFSRLRIDNRTMNSLHY